jgi:hypothetical protein
MDAMGTANQMVFVAIRELVSFYGMLAQGLTRNTFIGGEGCTLQSVDAGGRFLISISQS